MLLNLKAEYARKNIVPYVGVMNSLGCSEKTARNKLNGVTPMTVPEALIILHNDFGDTDFAIEYLFATVDENA